jgi:hypothetical protein
LADHDRSSFRRDNHCVNVRWQNVDCQEFPLAKFAMVANSFGNEASLFRRHDNGLFNHGIAGILEQASIARLDFR